MYGYTTPLNDIMFIIRDVLESEKTYSTLDPWGELSYSDIEMIVIEAGKFCEERIHPNNFRMGEEGCSLEGGAVSTPKGLREIYQDFSNAGWLGVCAAPEDGGQGLPKLIHFTLMELLSSSSLAFSDYIGTFCSTYEMVKHYADRRLKDLYLKDLASGKLGGTQCMTEPHCGTDMSLCRTRADIQADGSYKISGTKIFISGGDQDLTHNIVHIVLARVPEDGPGNRGLSLFLVPKYLPGEDNSSLERNSVMCTHLEHKMGYATQATCQMNFEGATGWLLGERGRGLGAMFTMVNEARLSVGCQGFSAASAAYQQAANYSRDRLQGRAAKERHLPDEPADPIIVHADVRRLLLTSRAFVEVARATYYWLGIEHDKAERHPDSDERENSSQLLSLLTSVFKAVATDFGFQSTNDAMQIFGGHGYVRETAVEHYVRDCRVAQIYEGANGMLAADLIKRFVLNPQFNGYDNFIDMLRTDLNRFRDSGQNEDFVSSLASAINLLTTATDWLRQRADCDIDEIASAGIDYQRIFGLTLFMWMWAKMAFVASERLADASADNRRFYEDKLTTGRFFMKRMLPYCEAHWVIMQAGAPTIMLPDASYF
jgi:alkylation response protein AidB-like acyl-CoA dehydrogenase